MMSRLSGGNLKKVILFFWSYCPLQILASQKLLQVVASNIVS